jgi:membrane-associated protein
MYYAAGPALANPISPDHLLSSFGLLGMAIILFAECGLLIGFFLPGDTLLLAAGVSLATGSLKTPLVSFLIVAPLAAVAGNVVGYWIGQRAGPAVFTRPNSKLFDPSYVERSRAFFDRFGWATIFLARFVPVVRTVATVLAGVGGMNFARYLVATVVGGIIWSDGVLLLGYWLGHFRFVQENKGYVDVAMIIAVVLSLAPTALHYRSRRRQLKADRASA